MNSPIPTGADLTSLLAPLTNQQLNALAHHSGVPFTTLWKIRAGETTSPGVDTARKFYPLVWPQVCIPEIPAVLTSPAPAVFAKPGDASVAA